MTHNDLDEDGVSDAQDVFPDNPNEWADADLDGVGDNSDARPADATTSSAITWSFAVEETGDYEVWASVPGGANRTAAARYTVAHAGGSSTVTVNQRQAFGEVYLGEWSFDSAGSYSVALVNAADGYAVGDQIRVRAASVVGGPSDAPTVLFEHADHLGAPLVVTAPDRSQVWWTERMPFGGTENSGSIDFDARFPGQWKDGESGLSYNYYRDYDPKIGRYVQSDPIGLAGGINTYLYAMARPTGVVDPEGLVGITRVFKETIGALPTAACEMRRGYWLDQIVKAQEMYSHNRAQILFAFDVSERNCLLIASDCERQKCRREAGERRLADVLEQLDLLDEVIKKSRRGFWSNAICEELSPMRPRPR